MNIHSSSDVQSDSIGTGTNIWQFCVVMEGAKIGADCNICSHVLIENDVEIGDRVTVKSGVQIWNGISIFDDVFIGPNVTFTNDKYPRSKIYPDEFEKIVIKKGASIGANATILPGITVGSEAMIGAGSVVTRNVPPRAIVTGNPARIIGYSDTKKSYDSVICTEGNGTDKYTSVVNGVVLDKLKHVSDLRGEINVCDIEKDIPFDVKRVFWVYNVPSHDVRGEHVHKVLEEYCICVKGSVSVVVDDGVNREEFVLDSPSKGLYLPPKVWRTLYKYTSDAALLVFASHEYDPDDYIRSYEKFKEMVHK